MQAFNHIYKDDSTLEVFIKENFPDSYESLLIQIFTGVLDKKTVQGVLDNLTKTFPRASIVGASTSGEIVHGTMNDNSIVISFAFFQKSFLRTAYTKDVNFDTGKKMGEDLVLADTKVAICFNEALTTDPEDFMAGFSSCGKEIIITGGNSGDNELFTGTFIIHGNTIYDHGIALCMIDSKELVTANNFELNWKPIGKVMTITRAANNVVYEIDHKPVLDVYLHYLGKEILNELPASIYAFPLLKKENGLEIARSIIFVNKDNSFVYAGHLKTGDKVQFSIGNPNDLNINAHNLKVRVSQFPTEAIFIYSCVARKTIYQSMLKAEMSALNSIAPASGFFTYGEFYSLNQSCKVLNITTTTLSLSESAAAKPVHEEVIKINFPSVLGSLTHLVNTTERELKESEQRYKILFEHSPDAIAIHANGVVINVNDFCVRLLGGHFKDEFIGQPVSRFIHPDYAQTVQGRLKSLATGEVKFLPILDEVFLRLDGSPMDVEVTTSLIQHEGKSAFQTVIRDKSERKKWERALIESESRLALASKIAHVGYWEFDIKANTLHWTDEVYHIYGYHPGEIVPTMEISWSRIHPDDRESLEKAMQVTLEQGVPWNMYFRFFKKDGSLRFGHVVGNVEYDSEGKPSKLGGVAIDVTEQKNLENELLESKKNLEELILQQKTILENAFVGIAFLQNRNFIWVNEKLEEIFGYGNGEIIGLKTDIIYPDLESYEELGKEAYPLLAAGKTFYKERLMKRKDGSLFWCELSGKAIKNIDALITGSIWIVQDISERKKWEKALVESESRLNRASKIAHVGHWELILATGGMYWADEIYNIFGYKPGEFETNLELTLNQLHPEDRAHVMEVLTYSIEKVKPIHVEFRFHRKDGALAYGEVMGDVEVNSNGKVDRVSGVFVDITHHRKYQEALRENEARLQALLENISSSIIVLDKNRNIKFVSKSVEKISGNTPEEVIANGFSTVHPDDLPIMEAALLKTMQNPGVPIPLELRIRNKKGEYRTYSVVGMNYLNNPLIEGIVINLYDMTSRKQLEENLRSANRAKSEFLANMSHEIRTPMNAIIGFTEILNKKISGEQEKKYLQSIMSSSKTLLRLINDILDLSKVEAGKMVMEYEYFDVSQTMEDIKNMFSEKAAGKNLKLELHLDKALPPAVYLDEVRFRQVFINLVSNSVKFTDSGNIKLSCIVRKKNRKDKTMELEITIQDTGIGISALDLDHIFDAFSQHSGNIAKYGGTGLGLTITKNLTTMMNGSIHVESKPGKGSEFKIIFHEVGYQDKKVSQINIAGDENIEFEKALILVVDDVVSNRDLIRGFFEDTSLEFIEAVDGKNALEIMSKNKPDLIVMDLRMPVMDGYEATLKLKHNPELKHIPVVIASASGMEHKTKELKPLIQGYLRKPIVKKELVSILKIYIKYKIIEKKDTETSEDIETSSEQASEVLKVLNQKTLKECESVCAELDFEKISKFIDRISRKTKDMEVKSLEKWILEMQNAVKLFDVDEIRKLSKKLSLIVKGIAKYENKK